MACQYCICGHVTFEEPVHVEKSQIDATRCSNRIVLVGGKTYLGRIGKLADYDPSTRNKR